MADDKNRKTLESFIEGLRRRNPGEEQFIQAVSELATSVMPLIADDSRYRDASILERMTEPDRIITFRVTWEDDDGNVRTNRAWRAQFNRAIGPYKGGLRFVKDLQLDTLKFLGFEQTFKNSLTGLPMGGAKGGANFNPKGKSDREVMRFCQSLMNELYRHIGTDVDVPAGDIGVGAREIGFLFGQYMALTNEFQGVLTGKGLSFGGSAVRTEATGYGAIYFCEHMLGQHDMELSGQRVAISGAGNVAIHACEKAIERDARVICLSDSDGTLYCSEGISESLLEKVRMEKLEKRGSLSNLDGEGKKCSFHKDKKPWDLECDVAIPCATQNELDDSHAGTLVKNGVKAIVEGANMPCTADAIALFREKEVLFAPGKAANAGGVAVSGLELSQNATRLSWDHEEVDCRLQEIMADIHQKCVDHGSDGDTVDYIDGANRAGFCKVADAMLAYGIV